jgi:hypothetical protein
LDRLQRPLFRAGVGGVDERFGEINFAAVAEILGEPLQQPVEATGALPLLKASMTGLIGRIAHGQVVPGRAGAQDPEHAVQHRARIGPRASAAIRPCARAKRRFEYGPLGVSQVHAARYDASPLVVTLTLRDL